VSHGISGAEEIPSIFNDARSSGNALYVTENAVTLAHRSQIIALALTARLPTTFASAAAAKAGGLMSYGPDFAALFRRAADLVDKILRGANPRDTPVEQPTKFDLVINLKTAKALGRAGQAYRARRRGDRIAEHFAPWASVGSGTARTFTHACG